MWWAVVTATTVGYGDHTPLTVEGRAIAVVLMPVGIGLLSVVTANVAAYFVEAGEEDNDTDIRERLERMEQMLNELLTEKSPASGDASPLWPGVVDFGVLDDYTHPPVRHGC